MVNTKIKSYKRRTRKGVHKVKGHVRKKRPVGKKVVKTKKVGTFVLMFDKYGNIKGSKVIKFKKKK
tara:strand:- start:3709 stop:3906 length:198 start_codon:yes stop_codon:yes gene_type:complete